MLNGIGPSSQTTYGTGQRKFLNFVSLHRLPLADVFPPSSATLLAFASHVFLGEREVSYKSCKTYLSHVKNLISLLGYSTSTFACPRLRLAVTGFRRLRPAPSAAKRLPVTVRLLTAFLAELSDSDAHHIVLAAALTVGVYGLFRSGELAVKMEGGTPRDNMLTRNNVTWAEDHAVIHLDVSKCDPFREGVDVAIHRNGSATCPFTALRKAFDNAAVKVPNAPLFQLPDGSPLTYSQLNNAIKNLASRIGLDSSRFAGHSLRIGGATSLAMLGYPDYVIKMLGRWASFAYQAYPRLTGNMRAAVTASLGSVKFSPTKDPADFFGGIDIDTACRSPFDDISSKIRATAAPMSNLGRSSGPL